MRPRCKHRLLRTMKGKLSDRDLERALLKARTVISASIVAFDRRVKRDLKVYPWSMYHRSLIENSIAQKEYICLRFSYLFRGKRVTGYLVQPRRNKRWPCVIYARSGIGNVGAVTAACCFSEMVEIASWGFVVIASQYPGVDGGEGSDEYGGSDLDALLALRSILLRYQFADSKRIGMYGISRGGMMAFLALRKVRWLTAVVAISAPSDLIRMKAFRPDFDRYLSKFIGSSKVSRKERSAIYWCEKFAKVTPVLLMCGGKDWRVNPHDSILLASRLMDLQRPCKLVVFSGDDHLLSRNFPEARRLTKDWLIRHVGSSKS